jgi:thiamine pyrophosphate-dependent acetolactate synthase large subunit-like protein
MATPGGTKHEIWTADDLGFVIMRRTESGNMTTTRTFRHLRAGEPGPSVFDIPHGYLTTDFSSDRNSPPPGKPGSAAKKAGGRGGKP